MSLSAWEQQALDSIKDGLAGSDPELAALLSAFTRLASGEDMPGPGKNPWAGPQRALRRLRRARWRPSMRRMCQRLGIQRAVLLLWLLTTAAMIAVALALNAGSDHGDMHGITGNDLRLTRLPQHSSGSTTHDTTTGPGASATEQSVPSKLARRSSPDEPMGRRDVSHVISARNRARSPRRVRRGTAPEKAFQPVSPVVLPQAWASAAAAAPALP